MAAADRRLELETLELLRRVKSALSSTCSSTLTTTTTTSVTPTAADATVSATRLAEQRAAATHAFRSFCEARLPPTTRCRPALPDVFLIDKAVQTSKQPSSLVAKPTNKQSLPAAETTSRLFADYVRHAAGRPGALGRDGPRIWRDYGDTLRAGRPLSANELERCRRRFGRTFTPHRLEKCLASIRKAESWLANLGSAGRVRYESRGEQKVLKKKMSRWRVNEMATRRADDSIDEDERSRSRRLKERCEKTMGGQPAVRWNRAAVKRVEAIRNRLRQAAADRR